jgi:hypothetical protein
MTSKPPKYRALFGAAIEIELLRDIRYSFSKRLVLSRQEFKMG